jgi:hypothetical protein
VTKRERLFPEIKRLREIEGLMWREIGERLGIPLKVAHDYYSDPTGTAAKRRKVESNARLKRTCPHCGGPMGVARNGAKRCHPCWCEEERRQRAARVELVARMYSDGKSYREIAAALGYGPNSQPPEITEARRRGLIGYRNRGYDRSAA